MIEPSELHILLRYDAATGKLFWLERDEMQFLTDRDWRAWNTRYAGSEAFTANKGGYRVGRIFGRAYKAHSVIWALVYGVWPDGEIDHENRRPYDNRLSNLRLATSRENKQNMASPGGTSRYRGVSLYRRTGKWVAYGRDASGRQRSLGYYSDEVEAAKAYDTFARREHGAFANPNFAA